MKLKSITFSAVSIFAFVFCANSSEISKNINLLSEIEPYCSYFDVVVSDTVAYCTNEYGLVLINVANPEDPQLIRRISTPGIANGLALRDTLLYLCDGYEGLKIFTISDLLNPLEIGRCVTGSFTYMIDIENDIACITHKDDYLYTIDIGDPKEPEILGRSEHGIRTTRFVKIIDGLVYHTDRRDDIFVYDLSDPVELEQFSYINIGRTIENNFCIMKQGDFLFILTDYYFITVDFLDPENPEILYERDIGTICNQMFLVGDELYIPAVGGGNDLFLYVFNISDPANPDLIRSVGTRINFRKGNFTFVANDIWYITKIGSGLSLFDISNLDEFSFLGELIDIPVCYNFLTSANGFLYPIDTNGRRQPDGNGTVLKTISIADPVNPEIIAYYGECFEQTTYHIKSISDDYLYFYDGSHNTTILNVENPEQPEFVDIVRNSGERIYEQWSNWVYTVGRDDDDNPGILVWNVINPSEPIQRNLIYLPEGAFTPKDIVATDNYLFVVEEHGLYIFTKDDPVNLELLSTFRTNAYDMEYWQEHVYVKNEDFVITIDVSDPENPREVHRFEQPARMADSYEDLVVENGILFLTTGVRGVFLFSLDDPAHPDPVGFYNTPGMAQDLEVIGNNFYVADKWGIGCYDYSECLSLWYLKTDADSLIFGNTNVGQPDTLELTLSSLSEIQREISNIQFDNEVFTCNTESPFSIDPLSDTTLSVIFTPQASALYYSRMTILSGEHELAILLAGRGRITNSAPEPESTIPLDYSLSACYPNPFNSTTRLTYGSPENSDISVSIFDMNGRLIKELVSGTVAAGNHTVSWDASNASAGIYLVKMKASTGFKSVVKVMLVK